MRWKSDSGKESRCGNRSVGRRRSRHDRHVQVEGRKHRASAAERGTLIDAGTAAAGVAGAAAVSTCPGRTERDAAQHEGQQQDEPTSSHAVRKGGPAHTSILAFGGSLLRCGFLSESRWRRKRRTRSETYGQGLSRDGPICAGRSRKAGTSPCNFWERPPWRSSRACRKSWPR